MDGQMLLSNNQGTRARGCMVRSYAHAHRIKGPINRLWPSDRPFCCVVSLSNLLLFTPLSLILSRTCMVFIWDNPDSGELLTEPPRFLDTAAPEAWNSLFLYFFALSFRFLLLFLSLTLKSPKRQLPNLDLEKEIKRLPFLKRNLVLLCLVQVTVLVGTTLRSTLLLYGCGVLAWVWGAGSVGGSPVRWVVRRLWWSPLYYAFVASVCWSCWWVSAARVLGESVFCFCKFVD